MSEIVSESNGFRLEYREDRKGYGSVTVAVKNTKPYKVFTVSMPELRELFSLFDGFCEKISDHRERVETAFRPVEGVNPKDG